MVFDLSGKALLLNLAVALLCGVVIAFVYRKVHRFPGYSTSFVNSLVLLTLLTAIVIMVIGNNLARAFGLVGAMSIIRFRTAIKETQDIVFIFFALSIGMAAGVGYHKIALLGTALVSLMMLFYARSGVTAIGKKEYLLQVVYEGEEERPAFLGVLKEFCRKQRVVNLRSLDADNRLEMTYYVVLKDDEGEKSLVKAVRNTAGVQSVSLYFDESPI